MGVAVWLMVSTVVLII